MSKAEGSVDELLSMIERGELHLPEMQRQDDTVIHAPSSIKNAGKGRGPKTHSDPQGRQFGYTKVRYRSLAMNAAQVLRLFAPAVDAG